MDPQVVQEVLERDRGCCVVCGSDSPMVQIAHIRSRGSRPDLLNEITNLALLCWSCHQTRQHLQGQITAQMLEGILSRLYGYTYLPDQTT